MTMFLIMMPLMVLAVAVAVVPVLYFTIREHNLIHLGSPTRPKPDRPVYPIRKVDVADRSADGSDGPTAVAA